MNNYLRATIVFYVIIAGLSLAMSEANAEALPIMDSADFGYKYEMDAMPTAVDADGAGGNDWNLRRFANGTTSAGVSGGILTMSSSTTNSAHYFTADESTTTNLVPPAVAGVWPGKTNLANGWTIEASVRILSDLGTKGALVIGGATATTTAQNGLLVVRGTGQYWGRGQTGEPYIPLGDQLDNTSDFHVFRIVQDPNPGGVEAETTWRVWRDNVLIAESLDHGGSTKLERAYFGHGSTVWAGSFEMDYLRFTPGAYAPVPEPASFAMLLGAVLTLACMTVRMSRRG